MADPLDKMAKHLESDPFFLACSLRIFAQSMKLNDEQLAEKLGCTVAVLTSVRLCRAPSGDAAHFQRDIARIVGELNLNADALTEVVRLGQAIFVMRGNSASSLMAARDGDKQD